MAQQAKFIDVTRTFLPVDPNAFPETLHGASREDAPENRIPVMAYKGYNFMPTAYGYRSYFGINQNLEFDPLMARVDNVFIFQSLTYENVLIALTESGIWTKNGQTDGAWVNTTPMVAPIDTSEHYEWTHTIINNTLYAYRQGQPNYQKFATDVDNILVITNHAPAFLNMLAQVGIYNAGGRLGFWDTVGSFSWANQDNFVDFVPSLETLAGNTMFKDVQGRVVTVLPHGNGFVIYATKSIVLVVASESSLYQWEASPILTNAGISYPRQACNASPDTIHFAYTSEGLKRIENGKQESIITDVTDFLRDYSRPIYVKILQGRYLFLEILDDDFLLGKVQFSKEIIPEITYTFPGADLVIEDIIPPTQAAICVTLDALTNGKIQMGQPDVPGATNMQPIWTAYLSMNGARDVDNIVWEAGACPTAGADGVDLKMSPGSAGSLSNVSQDASHKKVVPGTDAYIDGKWTIQRFVAAQNAIWEAEQAAIAKYISAITSRSRSNSVTAPAHVCTGGPADHHECSLGLYVSKWSAPRFGFSGCEFYLTRFATEVTELIRVRSQQETCKDVNIPDAPISGYYLKNSGTLWGYYGSLAEANQAASTALGYATNPDPYSTNWNTEGFAGDGGTLRCTGGYLVKKASDGTGTAFAIGVYWTGEPGWSYVYTGPGNALTGQVPHVMKGRTAGGYDRTVTVTAYNKGVERTMVPVPETAFCKVTGFSYTPPGGGSATSPFACEALSAFPPGDNDRLGGWGVPISDDGSFCGEPYTPPIIEGIEIHWPSTSVTLPEGSFLLQKGSIAPVYPTFSGALVYDIELKKWGKMRQKYKQLLDYSPINSEFNDFIPTATFGIMAGILHSDGLIYLFDQYPTDAYITYGKVGYYRLGKTSCEEVRVDFKSASTGVLKVATSIDGANLGTGLVVEQAYENARSVTLTGGYSGSWHNIEINGHFDISYLEHRGFISGRR